MIKVLVGKFYAVTIHLVDDCTSTTTSVLVQTLLSLECEDQCGMSK